MALETLITRRPVVDSRQHVYGYELLYASSSADSLFATLDPELAHQRLVDGLLTMGLKAVTAGQGAWSMAMSHYEPVPPGVQAQLAADHRAARGQEVED